MEQAGVQLIAAGGDVYISTITSATKATNTFVDATDSGSGKVSGAGQVMVGALRKVGEMAVSAFAEAAKATAGFLKDSVGLAGDFESGMLNFQAVAGKDVDTKGLDQFKDLFLSLGKELPVSTSEVQQAAIEMIKGGIDPAIVAAGGLKQNIQFAAAAMEGDLVKAAEISSKILGGWAGVNATAAEKADFLTHATDLLTKAANASSTDVEGLSLGIFNAQGTARNAGVEFDDLTTTLAALAPRFESSAIAGNSLKNFLIRLQPTTDSATAAMIDLGLYSEETGSKFYDAQGNFIGLQASAQLLHDAVKDLTPEMRQSELQAIFLSDAMGAAAGLAEIGAEGYQNMADALDKANGVQENAALKQQGFNTALDNAKGSVEALQITIGSALLPVLTSLLNDVVAPAINTFTDLASAVFGSDEAFSRLSPTLQGIVSVIDIVVADVQEIIGAFNDAGAGSNEFAQRIDDLATDLGAPAGLVKDIVSAVQDLVAWFSQAGSEGDNLGGVIEDLNGIWNKALQVITDVGDGYLAVAQAVLPIVSQFWEDHGTAITAFLKTAYDKIMSIINVALDLYDAIVPKVLGNVAQWIEEHATGIQAVLSGAWQAISGIIDGALTLIEGVLKIALDVINGDWKKAWTDLQTMCANIVLDLEQVIEGFLNIIAGFFNTSLDEIVKIWTDNWNQLIDIATSIDWGNVGYLVVAGIIGGIDDNADRLFSTLKNLASSALDAAKEALGISSPSKEFAAIGVFAVQGLMQGFSDTWPQLTDMVGSLSEKLIGQMQNIGGQIQNIIADSFGATASIDRQIAKNLDRFKDVLPAYQQYTQGALKQAQQEAEAFADPAEGAKFFKMRSDQILEYAKLQKDLADATEAANAPRLDAGNMTQAEFDAAEKARQNAAADVDRIQQQMLLINRAQQAELDAFNATKTTTSPALDIANQINEIMKSIAGINLTDDQIKIVDMLSGVWYALQNVPGRAAGGPVNANQPYWVGEQGPELFWPQTNGMVSPAASSAQLARAANTTNYNGQVGNTFNMPIYTNNSPAAIQQSWAVLQASMP